MIRLDEAKLKNLQNASEYLEAQYGVSGTESREAFEAESLAYYYGVIMRDRRKELKMTQAELAKRVGTARTYISRVEKGETDIQMSSFFRIASALGLTIQLI